MSLEAELLQSILKDSISPEVRERIIKTVSPKIEKAMAQAIERTAECYIEDMVSDVFYTDKEIRKSVENQVRATFNLEPKPARKGK